MNDILATITDIDMQKTFAEYLNIDAVWYEKQDSTWLFRGGYADCMGYDKRGLA